MRYELRSEKDQSERGLTLECDVDLGDSSEFPVLFDGGTSAAKGIFVDFVLGMR